MPILVVIWQTAIPQSTCQVPYFICYMANAMCYMSSVICQMLWAICQTPCARLLYAKCYDHCYVFLVWLQNRLDISLYISITRLWLSILPLQRRNCYYTTMASIYISGLRYFSLSAHQVSSNILSHIYCSMPTYHGIDQNLHITVYFGMPAYHGII
jgi:hypothetical protein